jgi:precorrin-6Y C5,15-methyltransferase (decarboxylating)
VTDCSILGILDDGWAGLTDVARAQLSATDCVIGVGRTLALVAPHLAPAAVTHDMDGQLAAVPGWVATARAAGQRVVVLASGDPLCHGIANHLIKKLGSDGIVVLPAPSTAQLAFARLKRPWQGVRVLSVHGADAGEWDWGAAPTHGLYELLRALEDDDCIASLTGPANSPDRIARMLVQAGYAAEWRLSVVARLCLPDETVFADLDPQVAAQQRFPDPNVVILSRSSPRVAAASFGFADARYAQRHPEKGLITKREARAVSLAQLAIASGDTVWDIGAGSGSVGIEASRLARRGHVWAIEKNAADVENARENMRRFRATNYTVVEGRAPQGLETWPDPDAVFIGGSGGELAVLIELVWKRLKPGGRFVLNFVTLENLATATAALAEVGANWQVTQLQAARSQPILDMHRLAAENPVWIVSALKQ